MSMVVITTLMVSVACLGQARGDCPVLLLASYDHTTICTHLELDFFVGSLFQLWFVPWNFV